MERNITGQRQFGFAAPQPVILLHQERFNPLLPLPEARGQMSHWDSGYSLHQLAPGVRWLHQIQVRIGHSLTSSLVRELAELRKAH